MSSIIKRPNGHVWIQYGYQGKRHTMRMRKAPMSVVRSYQAMIDKLVDFRSHGYPPDPSLAAWIESLSDRQQRNLARSGLIDERETMTAAGLVDLWVSSKTLGDSTKANYGHVRRNLKEFFGESSIQEIRPQQCNAFRDWLMGSLADATVAKRCRRAKSVFNQAVRMGLIKSNPWDGQELPQSDKDRQQFITAEQIDRILAANRDPETRLMIVMARYGGLRCPSEFRPLLWSHVDWDVGKLLIHAPKTARYKHKQTRYVPLFPQIREYLEEVSRGKDHVFAWMHTVSDTAIRKRLVQSIKRAGLVPWAKPWQNLRASAATWMTREFGPVLAARWCGHSVRIADDHYWMITDDVYQQASQGEVKSEVNGVRTSLTPGSGVNLA